MVTVPAAGIARKHIHAFTRRKPENLCDAVDVDFGVKRKKGIKEIVDANVSNFVNCFFFQS